MRRMLLLGLTLAATGAALAQAPEPYTAVTGPAVPLDTSATSSTGIDAYVRRAMRERGMPGVAVAILKAGRIVHARGYGVSNLELGTPVTPQSSFNLASVSKAVTALLVMRMVQDGSVALNDPIERHVGNLPTHWHGITIAQLLSHTSGIPSFTVNVERRCNPDQAVTSYGRGDAIREVTCHPLDFAPGTRWSYGDTGYYLLGMLIERVTGSRYEQALERWITGPLGMRATHVLDYRAIVPLRVDGYAPVADGFRNAPRFEFEEIAGGGLVSTLADMIRLIGAFESDLVLTRPNRERMRQPAMLADGTTAQYGLGLGLTPYQGKPRYGHSGGGGMGFATAFTHFPGEGVTVIVLSNADQPPGAINDLAHELAGHYFLETAGSPGRPG